MKQENPEAAAASPKVKISKPKKDKPAKITVSKKRSHDDLEGGQGSAPIPTGQIKKLKFTTKKTPTTPYLKLKNKGRPPPRPRGVGYDSEAEDKEEDPAIEEEFVIRMQPGEDCDYLRQAIAERNWGRQGAAVRLKFLQADGRRAVVIVRGRIYAAVLVDLPCIVEGMKSWDRKAWFKSADICQMLLVLGAVPTEADALSAPLPPREVNQTTWGYEHGLTPPMRWVRKRRFRKRLDAHTIEDIEAQVETLLRKDEESVGDVKYELIDPQRLHQGARDDSEQVGTDDDEEEEVEYVNEETGEAIDPVDFFGAQAEAGAVEEEDMAAAFEDMLGDDQIQPAEAATEPQTATETATPAAVAPDQAAATGSEASTPAAGLASNDDSGDEDDESDADDNDEDEAEEVDEDEQERRTDEKRQREEIADIEGAIKSTDAELERLQNPILTSKLRARRAGLVNELQLKKAALGEDDED